MKSSSGDPEVTDTGEVGRLQEELQRAKERLQIWKEKTQAGVNELRGRIVDLTRELEESQAARKQLEERLLQEKTVLTAEHETDFPIDAAAPSSCSTATIAASVALPLGSVVGSPLGWSLNTLATFMDVTLQKTAAVFDVAAAQCVDAAALADTTRQELDKYKRRTVQGMRLQAKNAEALQEELHALRQQLDAALAEVREKSRGMESREAAMTILQNRLDDAEAENARLESSHALSARAPNAEEWNAFEARLESAVEAVRREFATREALIFEQHRDEMERLAAAQERDLAELRAELEDVAPTAPRPTPEKREADANDSAYAELLRDYEAVRNELSASRAENERMRQNPPPRGGKTANLTSSAFLAERGDGDGRATHHAHSGSGSSGMNGAAGRRELTTLPEALARVAELESGTRLLSDELCEVKKRLVATKHHASSKDLGRSHVIEGQQLSYLRVIIVKLLSAKGDENVAMNLLPVLSTLLHFEENNLRDVYAANPNWVKRKF